MTQTAKLERGGPSNNKIEYTIHEFGVEVKPGAPLTDLITLMKTWSEEYGWDIVDATIASKLGAAMVLTNKEDAKKWREQLFTEANEDDSYEARIEAWCDTEDTGLSSVCIWETLSGKTFRQGRPWDKGSIPYDPDDFSRCHKLLKLIPEWYERLQEVADEYPQWQPLVSHWHELEDLYEEEDVPQENGWTMMPKLYERMKELRKEYEDKVKAEKEKTDDEEE